MSKRRVREKVRFLIRHTAATSWPPHAQAGRCRRRPRAMPHSDAQTTYLGNLLVALVAVTTITIYTAQESSAQ